MLSTVNQLFTPLSYVRIEHPLKRRFDIYIPLVCTIALLVIFYVLPNQVSLLGERGFVSQMSGLLQILIGFFIASLAAVSTFQRDNLDEPIEGSPAELEMPVKGVRTRVKLTRRRFLCYLFGYLSLLSLILYMFGVAGEMFAANVALLLPAGVYSLFRFGVLALYLFLLSNLFVTTLLGLHYMTDRIHR